MSLLSHFHELFQYEQWANERTLVSLDSVPADRRHGPAYDRLMGLLPHNLIARRVWRWRILGEPHEKPADWFPKMSVADTRALAVEVDRDWEPFLGSIKESDLTRLITFRTSDGTQRTRRLDHLITHVFNHATYHRGQIARLVTEHGGERAVTDFMMAFEA